MLISLLVFPMVNSCRKDEQKNNYSYFVSKDYVIDYTVGYINTVIDAVSATTPEVQGIKSLVASDVDVYKVVYNTTADGKKITASGLICVPVTSGEYPVLSFQNGTNTLNADAPSVFPEDYTYQMVEFIASMGYIVVIADYPGFGESSQIPHPYLVSEPTVRSLVDLLFTVKEMIGPEFPGITLKNEYYLLGYSQGGWATLALHKAIEQNYGTDFTLKGSACGAGPYNILQLLENMINKPTYPMPVYLAYIVNAYIAYHQFTNPATDIFKEQYASKLNSLFTGLLTSDQINSQLTSSIADLMNPDLLAGFSTNSKYTGITDALNNNSIAPWHTVIPLLLTHGANDTQVDPLSTENMYTDLIQNSTSPEIVKKAIVPGVDHSDGALPCMILGITFLNNLKESK